MADVVENNSAEEEDRRMNGGVVPECDVVTVPRSLVALNNKKLVLHIDLNNTILVSDAVTGQGTVAALDTFLTSVTWGKLNKQGKQVHSPVVLHSSTKVSISLRMLAVFGGL